MANKRYAEIRSWIFSRMPKTTLLDARGAQTRFDDVWNFTPIFIFNTLRIFHVKLVTSEGGGEVCIFLVGNNRAFDPISNEASNLTSRISDKKFVCLLKNSQEKRNFPLFSIGNKKLKALLIHVRMKQQLEGREKPTKIS